MIDDEIQVKTDFLEEEEEATASFETKVGKESEPNTLVTLQSNYIFVLVNVNLLTV